HPSDQGSWMPATLTRAPPRSQPPPACGAPPPGGRSAELGGTLGAFAERAVASGVTRLVMLSGRGEEEAERGWRAVRDAGARLTVLRATWFAQNFSETYWREGVRAGELALPAGDTPEPFVDVDDIADVAV